MSTCATPKPSSSETRYSTKRPRTRVRSLLGRASVLAAVLVVGFATAAFAAGVKGDPQPELAQFTIGSHGSDGTGVVMSDGTIVVASQTGKERGEITVCRMKPGARKCESTATLLAYKGDGSTDSFYAPAQVLTTGGKDVDVVTEDCCDIPSPSLGGEVMFQSKNDGKTFGKETPLGNLDGFTDGVTVGKQLVFVVNGGGGTYVQAYNSHPSGVVKDQAHPSNVSFEEESAIGSDKGGVLVAASTGKNTYVEYAKPGSDFNKTSSYKKVGKFTNQTLFWVSGNALLTDPKGSLTGSATLRFFNGTKFGSPHTVRTPKHGDDGYYTMQEVGGVVHVFFEDRGSYDLFTETTTNGTKWSQLTSYASAIDSNDLSPVIGQVGSGITFEVGTPNKAQPVLDIPVVRVGIKGTSLTGSSNVKLKGQSVTLERLSSGSWYTVSTTKESSSGGFSFHLSAHDTYRAVVNYKPGYYEYGYSNSVTGG